MLIVFYSLFHFSSSFSNYSSSFEGDYFIGYEQHTENSNAAIDITFYTLSMDSSKKYNLIPINASTKNILDDAIYDNYLYVLGHIKMGNSRSIKINKTAIPVAGIFKHKTGELYLVQSLEYFLPIQVIKDYINNPKQPIIKYEFSLFSFLFQIQKTFKDYHFDYKISKKNLTFFEKVLNFVSTNYQNPNTEITINSNKLIPFPTIYLKKVKSVPRTIFDFNYNLEGLFQMNITYYPPFDFGELYDIDERNIYQAIEFILNICCRKLFGGQKYENYLAIKINQINKLEYLEKMRFYALCYLPSFIFHLILIFFDITDFEIICLFEFVYLISYNITVFFTFFKKIYHIHSYIMIILKLFKIENFTEILFFIVKGTEIEEIISGKCLLLSIGFGILYIIFCYIFGFYSVPSMIFVFSNLFFRSYGYYKKMNQNDGFFIKQKDISTSICIIIVTLLRFFDTYFHFLKYENKIYLGKPNNILALEIVFGWILIQIAFLIYQLRAYKHPIQNEIPKINFEQDQIRERIRSLREQGPIRREQDPLLREHDRILREQDPIRREQDLLLREQDPLLREYDQILREQDPLLREHDLLLREQDPIRREHDRILREQNPIRSEQDRLLREMPDNKRKKKKRRNKLE